MQEILNLFIHAILVSAGIFGLYISIRLTPLRRSHVFYMIWLLSHAIMFLMFSFLKNGIFDSIPFLYRFLSPLYYFAPGCLYLFFMTITMGPKPRIQYWVHVIPVIIMAIIAFVEIYFFPSNLVLNIQIFQDQIRIPRETYIYQPFQLEKLLFALRSILAVIYVILIDKVLKKRNHDRYNESWHRLFMPIRVNVYLVITVLIPHQLFRILLNSDIAQFYVINGIMIVAAFMFLWHVLLVIKDLEKPNSIFKNKAPEMEVLLPTLNIPEKSLFILHRIYHEKLYTDPMLSIGKVAEIFGISEEKFSVLFNNTIPFSFSSYINYLRLLNFDKMSNEKFSKEANIANAGFNSRASYYQWEKRKSKLAIQIDPVLESINHKNQP